MDSVREDQSLIWRARKTLALNYPTSLTSTTATVQIETAAFSSKHNNKRVVTTLLVHQPQSWRLISLNIRRIKAHRSHRPLWATLNLNHNWWIVHTVFTPLTQSKCLQIVLLNLHLLPRRVKVPRTLTRQIRMLGLQCHTSVDSSIAISSQLLMVMVNGAVRSLLNWKRACNSTSRLIWDSFSQSTTMSFKWNKLIRPSTQMSAVLHSITRS